MDTAEPHLAAWRSPQRLSEAVATGGLVRCVNGTVCGIGASYLPGALPGFRLAGRGLKLPLWNTGTMYPRSSKFSEMLRLLHLDQVTVLPTGIETGKALLQRLTTLFVGAGQFH
jgi:hypothetical protein